MRAGERRDVWTAFATLFALIASHALLETARDALFLAKVPASRLPLMFLAIALLSVGLVKLNTRVTGRLSSRRALSALTPDPVSTNTWSATVREIFFMPVILRSD